MVHYTEVSTFTLVIFKLEVLLKKKRTEET